MMIGLVLVSCDDFVDVSTPKNQIDTKGVFSSNETALSAISGVYAEMMTNGGFASGAYNSVTFLSSLSGDDLMSTFSDTEIKAFYTNSILPTNSLSADYLWSEPYKFIYYANSILDGLSTSTTLEDSVSRQIEGEAKFIRAFCNFYLVNLFGDVPIVKTTPFEINTALERSPKKDVYAEIITDLLDAEKLLSDSYEFSVQRVRPNKYAASALLARVYLYNSEWDKAEQYASAVIENSSLYSLADVSEVFKMDNTEAIWQLMPPDPWLLRESTVFILTYEPLNNVYLNPDLVASFDAEDSRLTTWIDSIKVDDKIYFFAYKYTDVDGAVTEYSTVLRLAEQYLIRAEARAHQNKISLSVDDLNVTRTRANAVLLDGADPSLDQAKLLDEIELERRREFFTEWGHRWLDLKRWQSKSDPTLTRADDVLPDFKGNLWQRTDVLYPIPNIQLQNDPNMVNSQNPGY